MQSDGKLKREREFSKGTSASAVYSGIETTFVDRSHFFPSPLLPTTSLSIIHFSPLFFGSSWPRLLTDTNDRTNELNKVTGFKRAALGRARHSI